MYLRTFGSGCRKRHVGSTSSKKISEHSVEVWMLRQFYGNINLNHQNNNDFLSKGHKAIDAMFAEFSILMSFYESYSDLYELF
jgi:hypothetical protein